MFSQSYRGKVNKLELYTFSASFHKYIIPLNLLFARNLIKLYRRSIGMIPPGVLTFIGLLIVLAGFAYDNTFRNNIPSVYGSIALVVGTSLMFVGIIIGFFSMIIQKTKHEMEKERKQ